MICIVKILRLEPTLSIQTNQGVVDQELSG
jgi:hypothetical protein